LIELHIDKDGQFRIHFNCFDKLCAKIVRSQAQAALLVLHDRPLIKDRELQEVLRLQLTLAPTAALAAAD